MEAMPAAQSSTCISHTNSQTDRLKVDPRAAEVDPGKTFILKCWFQDERRVGRKPQPNRVQDEQSMEMESSLQYLKVEAVLRTDREAGRREESET